MDEFWSNSIYAKHSLSVTYGDLQLEINFLLALLENLFFVEQLKVCSFQYFFGLYNDKKYIISS